MSFLKSFINKNKGESGRTYFIFDKITGNGDFKLDDIPLKINLATKITIGRILAGPLLIILVFYGHHKTALTLFILTAISDALDGFIARTLNQGTWLGSFLDPLADKLFLISTFIAFTFFESAYKLPMWLTVAVFFRDVMIMSGCLFFEIVYGKLKYSPLKISKWTTFFQILCVSGAAIWNALYSASEAPILFSLLIDSITKITLILTILSGLLYFRIALRILNELSEKRNAKNSNGSKRD